MLFIDRFDISEGIDVNETCASKECDVCHYWYFLNYSFKFQPNVCNRCHKNLLSHIKMGREILTFGDIEIEKNYDGLMDKLNGCIL